MTIIMRPILDALESHALASGQFARVNRHEPKSAPGTGLTCAIWASYLGPARGMSGLSSTTGLLVFSERIYTNAHAQEADEIDPVILDAVDDMCTRYSGDFTLGGLIRDVDLLGESGRPLEANAGYVTIDQKQYRCMVIQLPLIINDVWSQHE